MASESPAPQNVEAALNAKVNSWMRAAEGIEQRFKQYAFNAETKIAQLQQTIAAIERGAEQDEEDITSWEELKIGELLLGLGEDPNRRELIETPKRMWRAWKEHLSGYLEDPEEILSKTWPAEGGGMLVLRDIFFTSLCEHHCLSFIGHVDIAYEVTSKGEVIGLSKLPRLVHCFAARLQIQERMGNQIADALEQYLDTVGVAVRVRAQHLCCVSRGVKAPEMTLSTHVTRGKKGRELLDLIVRGN